MTIKDFYDSIGGNYAAIIARMKTDDRICKFLKMFLQDKSYESLLQAMSEEKVKELKLRLLDPALASDYQKLMELQTQLEAEEHLQESLLENFLLFSGLFRDTHRIHRKLPHF